MDVITREVLIRSSLGEAGDITARHHPSRSTPRSSEKNGATSQTGDAEGHHAHR